MKKYDAEGKLNTKFILIIPFILHISYSKIFDNGVVKGIVGGLHITPFFVIGFVVPSFLLKK